MMNLNDKLRKEIIIACKNCRFDVKQKDIDEIIDHLKTLKVNVNIKIQAIQNGSIGMYGIPFKFSPVVFSYWINRYLKETNKNNDGSYNLGI